MGHSHDKQFTAHVWLMEMLPCWAAAWIMLRIWIRVGLSRLKIWYLKIQWLYIMYHDVYSNIIYIIYIYIYITYMANSGFSLGSWVIITPSCVLNVLWQIPRARRKPDSPERVATNIGGCTIWWVNYGHLIKLYAMTISWVVKPLTCCWFKLVFAYVCW